MTPIFLDKYGRLLEAFHAEYLRLSRTELDGVRRWYRRAHKPQRGIPELIRGVGTVDVTVREWCATTFKPHLSTSEIERLSQTIDHVLIVLGERRQAVHSLINYTSFGTGALLAAGAISYSAMPQTLFSQLTVITALTFGICFFKLVSSAESENSNVTSRIASLKVLRNLLSDYQK